MLRKRIAGGRGSLIGCALMIVVACGTDPNDTTPNPSEVIPNVGGNTSHRAAQGGTGGAKAGSHDGASSGNPNGGSRSTTADSNEDGASTDSTGAEGTKEETLGAGGDGDDAEVLELPPECEEPGGTCVVVGDCCSGSCAEGVCTWDPAEHDLTAWYVASPTDVVKDSSENVSTWYDRSDNHHDVVMNFAGYQPVYWGTGWNDQKPTVRFNGTYSVMQKDPWPAETSPIGTEAPYTVLAVMKASSIQSGAITSWWGVGGLVATWIEADGSDLFLKSWRNSPNGGDQQFRGSMNISTSRHVLAYRYDGAGTLKHTVDGATEQATGLSSTSAIVGGAGNNQLLMGWNDGWGTTRLHGDISEIVVIPEALSDADVAGFGAYAKAKWEGLNLCEPNCVGKPPGADNECGGVCDGQSGWTPQEFNPLVWYSAGLQYITNQADGVSEWIDRSPPAHNVVQTAPGYRPQFQPNGWNGNRPTLHFDGTYAFLRDNGWDLGSPNGSDEPFTVLAVIEPSATAIHRGGIASWYGTYGGGWISTRVVTPDGTNLFGEIRRQGTDHLVWAGNDTYTFTGSTNLVGNRHVIAYRFGGGRLKITVDGTTEAEQTTHDPLTAVGGTEFLIGREDTYYTRDFAGNLSELIVIGRELTDAEVETYREYANATWGGLAPVCSCAGKPCGASNGCGGTCTCGPGDSGCATNVDCDEGLLCIDSICKPGDCTLNPVLIGCGFPGAPCGPCTRNPQCETDADCPPGLVCKDGNGWKYGVPGANVCEPEDCTDCGTITSPCGLCDDCVINCSEKQCGDPDLSDGCNGRCPAVCDDGEGGCQMDSDCQPGSVCLSGTCRPADPCASPNVAPPDCGDGSSLCGPCPTPPGPACADRACGGDPSCGSCGAGFFCNATGGCARLNLTLPIRVPDASGGDRDVIPGAVEPALSDIEAIPGVFQVNDSGSATYSIKIETPPGRGVEPSLALRYVSGAPNEALGVGWSLDGLSTITRCRRTFAQDGRAQAVRGTLADAVCLDGERLVPVPGSTEWQVGAEYRTAVDSFRKVKLEAGDGDFMFRVYAKDGGILTYGQTPTSRLKTATGVADTWALTRVEDRMGNFMRITYRPSLLSVFTGAISELLPDAITYSGKDSVEGDREIIFGYQPRGDVLTGYRPGGGSTTRSQRLRTIDVRANNQNVRRYTLGYEEVARVSRLTTISECDGPTLGSCKVPTKVDYLDDNGFLPGELGIWPPNPGSSVGPPLVPSGMISHSDRTYPGDVFTTITATSYGYSWTPIPWGVAEGLAFVPTNGPYLSAIATLANLVLGEDSQNVIYHTRSVQFSAGINGADIIDFGQVCGGNNIPRRQLFTPSLGEDKQLVYDTCPKVQGAAGIWRPAVWLIDVDGDGAQDKFFCSAYNNQHFDFKFAKASESASNGVPIDATGATRDGYVPSFNQECEDPGFSAVFDVDGDGVSNLVVYDKIKNLWGALDYHEVTDASGGRHMEFAWRCADPDDADPFHPEEPDHCPPDSKGIRWFNGVSIKAERLFFVTPIDANGDGLKDILALPNRQFYPRDPEDWVPRIAYNNGDGSFRQVMLTYEGENHLSPEYPGQVQDIDGDGVEELIDTVSWIEAFQRHFKWRIRRIQNGRIVADSIPSLDEVSPGIFGDFNGDGDADVLSAAVGGHGRTYQLNRGDAVARNHVNRIVDGRGRQVEVEYAHPPRPGELSCSWPQRCLKKPPVAVVTSHTESHYEDRARTMSKVDRVHTHTYGEPRMDVAGYGWLGFSSRYVEVHDSADAFVSSTYTSYRAPPPWHPDPSTASYVHVTAGLPETVEVLTPRPGVENGAISTRTDFHWQVRTSLSARPYPFLVTKTTKVSDVSFISMALYETIETFMNDSFGNVQSETRVSRDLQLGGAAVANSESVLQTTRTYAPTPAEINAWLVGQPKAIDIVSTPRCDAVNCGAEVRRRHVELVYYPDTDLVHIERREPGDASLERTTVFDRDVYGNVTGRTVTDANGNVRAETVLFDERGLFPVSKSRSGEGRVLTTQVRHDDRFGTIIASADPNGIDETRTYDEFGVERHYRGPSGETFVRHDVDDFYTTNEGVAIPAFYSVLTAKSGGESRFEEFNSLGQLVRSRVTGLAAFVYQELTYDLRQRLASRSRPHLDGDTSQGVVEFDYDALDKVILESYPDGATIRHDYALERRTSEPAPARATMFTHRITEQRDEVTEIVTEMATDRDRKPVVVQDPTGNVTQYSYGAFDKVVDIQHPTARHITFSYDAWGRRLSVTDSARGGPETATYNGLDEVILTNDVANRSREMFYDDFGRLVRIEEPGGIVTERVYDGTDPNANALDRLVETISPTGQRVSYDYEPRENGMNRGLMNRVTKHLSLGSERTLVTTHHFDGFSRLEQIDYPAVPGGDMLSVKYGFDGAGHVISAFNPNVPNEQYWQFVDAYQGHRVRTERLGNADCGGTAGTTTVREYFGFTGRLGSIMTGCDDTLLQNLVYDYDLAGNMTFRGTHTGTSETFEYDSVNRPTKTNGVTTHAYNDFTGALVHMAPVGSYGYLGGGGDWIDTTTSNSFDHDAVGNVILRQGADIPGGVQTIEYTSFDLPERIFSGPSGAVTPTEFAYDADGARVIKRSVSTQTTTYYAGDHYQRIETEGAPVRHRMMIYANGRAIAEQLVVEGGSSSIRYLYDDAIGSIETIADANGSPEPARYYALFGRRSTAPANDVPFGFTGHEEDGDLGLINMKRRMYDPIIGQFLSADPVMANTVGGQGLNRFAYVENSPQKFVDPTGMTREGFLDSVVDFALRVGEAAVLSHVGGQLAGNYGNSPWMSKELRQWHGSVNGAFTGARRIYSLDVKGVRAFYLDSTHGITGTMLGNYINIFDTAIGADYAPELSERQNRQVFQAGFTIPNFEDNWNLRDFAHTQGNVTSNFRGGSKELLDHETEHIWMNRIFGPAFTATYAGWLVGVGGFQLGKNLVNGDAYDKDLQRNAYRRNPWEAHAYCHNPGSWPDSAGSHDCDRPRQW